MSALPLDRLRPGTPAASVPRYADSSWPLAPLDHGSTRVRAKLTFGGLPDAYREVVRQATWTMLNLGLEEELVDRQRLQLARFPAPSSVHQMFGWWATFLDWLKDRRPEEPRLAEITEDDLLAWAKYLRDKHTGQTPRARGLVSVAALWGHGWALAPSDRLPEPPWIRQGLKRHTGDSGGRGENSTPPIQPEVMGPLLRAALSFIEDVLARDRTFSRSRSAAEATTAAAACLIVIAYLTGMRPKELVTLRRDCHTAVEGPGGGVRHEIRGLTYKEVRDLDGRYVTAGRLREQPWITVAPAALAVQVACRAAEVIDPGGELLFPLGRQGDDPRSVGTRDANRRIGAFIDHVNRQPAAAGAPSIPEDSYGPIMLSRFRRTLAWHIARQPLGEIALGVQYGHVQIVTGQGYAGRAAAGLQGLIEFEELGSRMEALHVMAEARRNGSRVSGPAADRLNRALNHFSATFEGQRKTEKQLKALKSMPDAQVHDNPRAHSVCVFNRLTAACLNVAEDWTATATPSLSNCQRSCANHAYMDDNVEGLLQERNGLAAEEMHAPGPIAVRLRARIAHIDQIAERHRTDNR